MNVTCIIPSACTTSTLPFLKRCIQSLKNSETSKVTLYVVVVTDNERAREKLLDLPINNFFLVDQKAGFSDRNNIAIEETISLIRSDYYLFINDDARIEKDFFRKFLKLVTTSKIDIINPMVYKGDDSLVIDSFGVEYFSSGYAKNATQQTVSTTLATAACLVVGTIILKKLRATYGYVFNPLYHYYLEDVDISVRARALGVAITKNPQLVAHHSVSQTSRLNPSFINYYSSRNLVWSIILLWPSREIIIHIHKILLIFFWVLISGSNITSPIILIQIIIDTFNNLKQLIEYRKKNISSYNKNFIFSSILSPYLFRARRRGFVF